MFISAVVQRHESPPSKALNLQSAGTQTRGALRYFAQAFVPLSVVL